MTRRFSFALFLVLVSTAASATKTDFDGDGHADVLWRRADGSLSLQRFTSNGAGPRYQPPYVVESSWIVAATPDVDGDGRSDVLWLQSNGQVAIWRMSGFNVAERAALAQTFGADWEFAGTGDVDGDGKDDLIWRNADHQLEVWFMNGTTVRARTVVAPGPVVTPEWHVVGSGDFDGDGHADVLWRSDTGQVSAWLLDGSGIRDTRILSPSVLAGARPAAIADFDGDGRDDVLWPDGSGGYLLWRMSGFETSVRPLGGDLLFANGFESSEAPSASLGAGWTVVQAGDFDGDGTADLILTDAGGNVAEWHMLQGTVDAVVSVPSPNDMPYPGGGNGWVAPLPRPSVTRPLATPTQLSVDWVPLGTSLAPYRLSLFDPAATPLQAMTTSAPHADVDVSGPVNALYFSVDTTIAGIPRPPSPRAYRTEFAATSLGYWGALAIADIDGDGCIDLLGSRGDCAGGFTPTPESTLGLDALRAPGRVYRDVRLADFDGDGIDDLIANVYSPAILATPGSGYSRILFFRGQAGGGFVEDTAFTARQYGGFGETIVVADFNNDGFLDVFLPNYSGDRPDDRCYLLINDGHGSFSEVADEAGVALRGWPDDLRVEGAQALDINDDGWIDLYVGSHLFINQGLAAGHLNFVDQRQAMGLPLRFDEGAKFIDWNNDGLLDLVTLAPIDVDHGPALFQFDGRRFTEVVDAFPPQFYNQAYGLNAADVDNDGRPDLIVAGGCGKDAVTGDCYVLGHMHDSPRLFLNRGTGFVQGFLYDDGLAPDQRLWNDLQTSADFDGNGAIDLVTRFASTNPETAATTGNLVVLRAMAQAPETMRLRILDNQGQENQQGRVVRVYPLANPDFVMTGIVDGGSGYMANTPYMLSFAAPYSGAYVYEIRFSNGVVRGLIHPGQSLDVRRNGAVASRERKVVDALSWLDDVAPRR